MVKVKTRIISFLRPWMCTVGHLQGHHYTWDEIPSLPHYTKENVAINVTEYQYHKHHHDHHQSITMHYQLVNFGESASKWRMEGWVSAQLLTFISESSSPLPFPPLSSSRVVYLLPIGELWRVSIKILYGRLSVDPGINSAIPAFARLQTQAELLKGKKFNENFE